MPQKTGARRVRAQGCVGDAGRSCIAQKRRRLFTAAAWQGRPSSDYDRAWPARVLLDVFLFATGTCRPLPPCGQGAVCNAGSCGPYERVWGQAVAPQRPAPCTGPALRAGPADRVQQHATHQASYVLRTSPAAHKALCEGLLTGLGRGRLSCCKAACAEASLRASCQRRRRRFAPYTDRISGQQPCGGQPGFDQVAV
jgi:hypothetical protein